MNGTVIFFDRIRTWFV